MSKALNQRMIRKSCRGVSFAMKMPKCGAMTVAVIYFAQHASKRSMRTMKNIVSTKLKNTWHQRKKLKIHNNFDREVFFSFRFICSTFRRITTISIEMLNIYSL